MVETTTLPVFPVARLSHARLMAWDDETPFAAGYVKMSDFSGGGSATAQQPGYNVVIGLGDSDMVGQGFPGNASVDLGDPRLFQLPHTGSGALTAVLAQDPLRNRNDEVAASGKIGCLMPFGRALLAVTDPVRNVLLVPHGSSGSGFEEGSSWGSGLAFAEVYIQAYPATGGGVASHTITIDTHVITLVASGATGQQINVGANAAALIANLRAYLVANVATLGFTTSTVQVISDTRADGSIDTYSQIVCTAKTAGLAGNSKTVTQSAGFSFLAGAQSSTSFVGGCDAAGGNMTNELITRANAAMTYGAGSNVLTAIVCFLNTNDTSMRPERFEQEFQNLVSKLRSSIAGATPSTPVIAMGQTLEYLAADNSLGGYERIRRLERATARLPSRIPYLGYTPAPFAGFNASFGESIFHHDAPLQRAMGASAHNGLPQVRNNAPTSAPGSFSVSAALSASLGVINVSWTPPATGNTRVTSQNLRYRKNGGTWVTLSLPVIATAWVIRALDLAASYEVQHQANNEFGSGPWSASATVATQAVPYVLDNLVLAPAAAFSLRKTRAAYGGSCIRVRRASDNTELDIGFAATGLLDTATLLAFSAGTSSFVKTWYDQAGSNNATQATAASQPRIVNASVLESNNGLPCIYNYDNGATAVYLESATGFPVAADMSMNAVVCSIDTAATNNIIGPASGGNHSLQLAASLSLFVASTVVTEGGAGVAGFNAVGVSYVGASKTGRLFRGGTFQASGSGSASATAGAGFQIGCYAGVDALQSIARITEIMIFASALSDASFGLLGNANTLHWG